MKYGIVVVGYEKLEGIKRLLSRLNEVEYYGDSVLLIISIDNSGCNDVYDIANNFQWNYGEKIIIHQKKRLGLKNHILKCGSYMEEYDLDAEAIFEDDIYPSKAFYGYMRQAVPFYYDDDSIAGISLYNYGWYSYGDKPFNPAYNGYDVYFMKYAVSWGQIWCKNKWKDFYGWYENNLTIDDIPNVPNNVKQWGDKSWLKSHIAYCATQNKYFVMPYESHSTMFGDIGVNVKNKTSMYQVKICDVPREYRFVERKKSVVEYDQWFEREMEEDVCVDIYGTKRLSECTELSRRYLCTTADLPYKCIDSFSLSLKPHEENVINKIKGYDIFVYDTSIIDNRKKAICEINNHEYYNMISRSKFWYVKYGIFMGIKKLFRINR